MRAALVMVAVVACSANAPAPTVDAGASDLGASDAPVMDRPPPVCVPGAQVACACLGGGQGVQVCATDGASLGACACPDAGSTDSGVTDVPSIDAAPDVMTMDDGDVGSDLAGETGGDVINDAVSDIRAGDVLLDVPADSAADAIALTPISVAAGYSFACVLMSDRSVWCRGNNESGQLGHIGGISFRGLIRVPLPSGAVQIVASERSACAVLSTGAFWCWGDEFGGTRGMPPGEVGITGIERADIGTMLCGIPVVRAPMMCRSLFGGTIMLPFAPTVTDRLSVNGTSVCALSRANPRLVYCADLNFIRREVTRTYIGDSTGHEWSAVVGSRQLGGSAYFWCAIAVDQSLWCWGRPRAPLVFGDGVTTASTAPVRVLGPASVAELSCSGSHCLARTPTGTVYFWGSDPIGSGHVESMAVLMPRVSGVLAVSAYHNTSCLMYANHVECRGIDGFTDAFITL